MGFLKNLFRSDGSAGLEHQMGNMRYDLNDAGNPTQILSENDGGIRTVIRPNGNVAHEWEVGNMRFSDDKNGFDTMF